jgi:prevent-host-death family protein
MSAAPGHPKRQVTLAQASDQLPAIVDDVAQHGPIEVTREGRPVAVIVSTGEYQRLSGDRLDAWTAYERFRASTDLGELDIDTAFDDVRDRSTGRDVSL